MKIKDGYVLREVAGNYFIIPIGEESINSSRMITVNESGRLIWEALQKQTDFDGIMQKMLDVYEVCEEELSRDVKEFLQTLKNAGILEE